MEREQENTLNIINDKLGNIFSSSGKKIFLALLCVLVLAGSSFAFMPKSNTKTKDSTPSALKSKAKPVAEKPLPAEAPKAIEPKKANVDVEVEVLPQSDSKMVNYNVEDFGRSNPFLPSSESFTDLRKYGFELMAPPETIGEEESEAAKIMTTKVSGIMYQPNNPSAILNIEGEDYLVRSGDYINNYRILSIDKDMVTVQLGVNIHKARVGEIITDAGMKHNNVYDLQNKFGGARR